MSFKNKKFFTRQLMSWYEQSHRPLPWKGIKNPYFIWLSEVILQQTRTEQGMPYYERFKKQYPTIDKMAIAPEDEIMKLWQGLGYYSRARNMHYTARYITDELDGIFPNTLKGLQELKGVGPYTAAAIASFAFDLPHAVVDGNVFRVLARFFGINKPIDIPTNKKVFAGLAQELLDSTQPGKYNQAIMDLGATVCTPKSYKCADCFLNEKCRALKEGTIPLLPVKSKKIKKKTRYFNYLVISYNGKVLIQKRSQKDIWKDLYQFPLVESPEPVKNGALLKESELWFQLTGSTQDPDIKLQYSHRQQLTHQKINGSFWSVILFEEPENSHDYNWVDIENLSKFAFPRIITLYLEDKSLILG